MTSHLATLFDDASRRGKPLSVLLIDIDHFKVVNDSHGHDAGDAVLREFATRIRRDTRGIDLACRLGGEEFVVVMPDCDLAMANQVGERLRQCIKAAPFEVGGKVGLLQVTASVGLAALEFDDDAPEHMLKRGQSSIVRSAMAATGLWSTQPRGLGQGNPPNHPQIFVASLGF
jgi:two-component system, cell cycle response regulator